MDAQAHERTGKGPFRDELDEATTTVVQEGFERVARGDSLWSVASFLTASGLPKVANSRKKEWSDESVHSMVRNPVYAGVEVFRQTHNVKREEDGRRVPAQTSPDEIMVRQMPHLAHVSFQLWQQANEAIEERDRVRGHPKGRANPTFRVPRDSRSPLSGHFFCGICGGKMIGQGRDDGGYRCGAALRDECWNKATVAREITHEAIFKAVTNGLLGMDGAADALVQFVQALAVDHSSTPSFPRHPRRGPIEATVPVPAALQTVPTFRVIPDAAPLMPHFGMCRPKAA